MSHGVLTGPARGAPLVIAHRGASAHAPENTMPAFERAVALGADALECDVRLTADGHVVVLHDATVDRTTDGHGPVAAMSLAQVRELDAGARMSGFAARGTRIPLLSDVLDAFPAMPLIVEYKAPAVADAATTLLAARGARERVLIGSFDHATLAVPRARGFATAASRREAAAFLPRAVIGLSPRAAPAYRAFAVSRTWRGVPVPVLGLARTANVPVHVWTVDDPAVATRLWRGGVTGIITNDPAAMLAARRRLG